MSIYVSLNPSDYLILTLHAYTGLGPAQPRSRQLWTVIHLVDVNIEEDVDEGEDQIVFLNPKWLVSLGRYIACVFYSLTQNRTDARAVHIT